MSTHSISELRLSPAQRSPPSLQLSRLWSLAGNITYAGTQWLLLIIIARLGGDQRVGQFALGLAVTAPVILFANLHFRTLIATDSNHAYPLRTYFLVRCGALVVSAIVLLSVAFFAFTGEARLAILAICLTKSIESLGEFLFGIFQSRRRMDWIAQSQILKGSISLVAVSLGLWYFDSLFLGLLMMAFGWMLSILALDHRRARRLLSAFPWDTTANPKRTVLQDLIRSSLPLGVMATLASLHPNIPRYFIAQTLGEEALGQYAAMAYFLAAGTTLVASLCQASSSTLGSLAAQTSRRGLRIYVLKLATASAACGAGIFGLSLIAGREILTVAYGPQFATTPAAFSILMAAGICTYAATAFWHGLVAMRALKGQVALWALTILTAAAASLVLIPRYGIAGAATAYLASTITCVALTAFMFQMATRRA